jgi:signal peptidase I
MRHGVDGEQQQSSDQTDPLPASSHPFAAAWDAHLAASHRVAQRHSSLRTTRELLVTLALAVAAFIGTHTVVQGREVRGPSMLPAYHAGQRLFVLRYLFDRPARGDVVVFSPVAGGRDDLIKRVIGVPGDRVTVRDGRVFVNGVLQDEPYLMAMPRTYCAGRWCDVTLGGDEYFVMGDNRGNSSDSRAWGPVPAGRVIGKAWLLYYPFDEVGRAP